MKKLDVFLKKKILQPSELLADNNIKYFNNHYTIPSFNLYPHQWSWDSAWIVYGYSATNQIEKAEKEMITLFNYQWKNGLVPSIIFHNTVNSTYWPNPELWELNEKANKLTDKFNSTGIVQPPIHSSACFKIYESNMNKSSGEIFLKKIYPKLFLWHKYLYEERDLFGEGLAFIRHPWESGMDNSPIWDKALGRIKINDFKYSKFRTDNKKVNSEERPTNITYERYIRLIEIFKECKYNESLICKKSEFVIQDVLFNVLLLKSNYALLEIAKIIDKKEDFNTLNNWINKTKNGLNKFYKDGFYYDFDIVANSHVKVKTISGLSSLLFTSNTKEIISVLKNEFLEESKNNYSISSISRHDKEFNSINYWRGPMWVNLTWLILSGLKKNNYHKLADLIKLDCMNKIEKLGFYEYFDSKRDSGCGDNHFSWTAAVYICMLSNMQF